VVKTLAQDFFFGRVLEDCGLRALVRRARSKSGG
jgi:hypothetical protein